MIIPEDIQRRWSIKSEQLSGERDLALPNPSMAALVMRGVHRDEDSTNAIRYLMKTHPDELPLDLSAGKCKVLDRQFYDAWRAHTGRPPRGVRGLEAVFLATDEALHYIAPNVNQHHRWPWNFLELRYKRLGRQFTKIEILAPDGSYPGMLGTKGAENLFAIYDWIR